MLWEDIEIEMSGVVQQTIEERHISRDEIKMVIHNVEKEGGIKLYLPDANRYLGKKIIGNATFYADYSVEGGRYIIKSAYAHRAEIVE